MKPTADSLKEVTDSAYIIQNGISDSLAKVYKQNLTIAENKLEKGPAVSIVVHDNISKKLIGTYKPNKRTGRFIIILPPGEFDIKINCEDYNELTETIKIADREIPAAQITQAFRLTKK